MKLNSATKSFLLLIMVLAHHSQVFCQEADGSESSSSERFGSDFSKDDIQRIE